MHMEAVMNSLHRLARSHGYELSRRSGSAVRIEGKGRAYKLKTLTRIADGTPGPEVVVRILANNQMVWERQ